MLLEISHEKPVSCCATGLRWWNNMSWITREVKVTHEFQHSDVSFCAYTIRSCFSHDSFHSRPFLLPSTSPSCQWCSLLPPVCPPQGTCPRIGRVSKSWWSSLLHAKEEAALWSAALQGGQFSSSAKSAKVRIRITRFQEKLRPFFQVSVTSQ